MKPRNSPYPIGTLILKCQEDSGLKLFDFVKALGYRNCTRGIKTFDKWLQNGDGNPLFLKKLCESNFAPDPEKLKVAQEATKQILLENRAKAKIARKEEERKAFKPYLQGIPEHSRPTTITFYGLTGGLLRQTVLLPERINDWEKDKRDKLIKELIVENYKKNNGRTLFRGKIMGYNFYQVYDERPLRYSVEGTYEGLGVPECNMTTVKLC